MGIGPLGGIGGYLVGTINNIFNIKIITVSSSASVNFGNTINIGADSVTKTVGGSNPTGDCARSVEVGLNTLIDPDLIDNM